VVHKHRSVKYLGINFDEGKRVDTSPCSWFLRNLTRLISLALLFMGLAVNFSLFFPHSSENAGMSGYLGLGRVDHAHYYISLVPSLVFSLVSLIIAATIRRYGKHSTLLIPRSCGWSWMLLGSVLQTAGQFPASSAFYPSTSMAGYTAFLVCVVCTHRLVLKDMGEAERITEFLRRQKAVQQQLAATCVLREGMRARRRKDAAVEARGEGGEEEGGAGRGVVVNGYGGRRRTSGQCHHHHHHHHQQQQQQQQEQQHNEQHQEQQEQQMKDADGVEKGEGGGGGGGGGGRGRGPVLRAGMGTTTMKMVRRSSGGKREREGGREGGVAMPSSVEMTSTAVVVTAEADDGGKGREWREEGGEGGKIAGGRGGGGGGRGGGEGLLRRVSSLFERQLAGLDGGQGGKGGETGGREGANGHNLIVGGDGETEGEVMVTMEMLDVRIDLHALPPPQGGDQIGVSRG